ncbi:hypothetical protein SDC9_77734 [bioreactor metagenome]|uniref:Uncharacterized protein n=1 Tax=bioreactor metagenome TaxID=1076179 RepID=A0A644YRN2_9ZZZZ
MIEIQHIAAAAARIGIGLPVGGHGLPLRIETVPGVFPVFLCAQHTGRARFFYLADAVAHRIINEFEIRFIACRAHRKTGYLFHFAINIPFDTFNFFGFVLNQVAHLIISEIPCG